MTALDWIMLIILLALEIPAAIFLVVAWVRACREAKNRRVEDGKCKAAD